MTERERLIDILNSTVADKSDDTTDYVEWLADELLENGVIVPCVKVGDMVWVIYDKCVMPANVLAVYVDKSGGMFDLKILTEGLKSVVNKEYTFDMVYLTKEEALKAMKGGAENG